MDVPSLPLNVGRVEAPAPLPSLAIGPQGRPVSGRPDGPNAISAPYGRRFGLEVPSVRLKRKVTIFRSDRVRSRELEALKRPGPSDARHGRDARKAVPLAAPA